jgi:maleylpyruvate isomerase
VWKLAGRWAGSAWEGTGISPQGSDMALVELPLLRVREVAIHHVDLGIGYEFEDLPAEYVRLEMRRMEMLWKARQPMGLTPLPNRALELEPPQRMAWLMGRVTVDGLAPADIY